ncbi:MAG: Alkaline phosphatase synthesis transcriptional regulatory protein PhoP [Syntrophorhabdus sp. PtaU1.Bin058]|nr:MAG: Alkaline phosphatase synthesis transcriptional regulatory protein PhoP [Syntrophorhabdus sp. PtaU1.Bin058]
MGKTQAMTKQRPARILIVDDEENVVDLITINLQRDGYQVVSAFTGEEALDLIKTERPDLIILDLMLPGIEGLEVCRQVRSIPQYAGIPILILSAKVTEVDRVLGLEMGANDYITKPFSVRELVSRVRVWLRKNHEPKQEVVSQEQVFSHKDLRINFERYEVTMGGKKILLSPKEMKLLFFFARNPGKVYSRDQLIDQIWGETFVIPRSVDVHISHLRRLIEKDPRKPAYIVTIPGVGYKFDDSES